MWILSVAGTSKIIFTSAVAGATRTYVRLVDLNTRMNLFQDLCQEILTKNSLQGSG